MARLEGKMTEYEHASANFPPREVANGPVFENQGFGDDINLRSSRPNGTSMTAATTSARAASL